MRVEVEVRSVIYVDLAGNEKAAKKLVAEHVANDWLLKRIEGTSQDAGHFIVKGLSGEVVSVKPFEGNGYVEKANSGEDIF